MRYIENIDHTVLV